MQDPHKIAVCLFQQQAEQIRGKQANGDTELEEELVLECFLRFREHISKKQLRDTNKALPLLLPVCEKTCIDSIHKLRLEKQNFERIRDSIRSPVPIPKP